MAKKVEKTPLKKGKAFFNIVGNAKITDFTFKKDTVSEKTGYKYSRLNLGIETKAGNVVYTEAMGGFHTSPEKDNVLYVASKEDLTNTYTIDWEDREDEKVLETIHPMKFIKIGIEKYKKDGEEKVFTRSFLSWYDAIDYLSEHIEDGMKIAVSGQLKYSKYNDKIQVKKEIQSIYLTKEENPNRATFTQTILIDKDSVEKLDKETGEYPVFTRVLDYTKMWGEKEVKTTVPFPLYFYVKAENDKMSEEQVQKFLKMFFKVKKGITELTVEGDIIEGTEMGEVTEDDIPDDMQELIDLGLYTKEDILKKLVVKGERVSKLVITKPYLKVEEKDGAKTTSFLKIDERYTDEDLFLDFMNEDAEDAEEEKAEAVVESSDDDDDWLKKLDD